MRVLLLGAVAIVVALGAAREPVRDPLEVTTGAELEAALSGPRHDALIVLAPGTYELTPASAIDSTCGNCAHPDTLIPITVGLVISGRNVRIEGPLDGAATIVTHAGYGLYFKDCVDCELEGVTITGGERDSSVGATDAAIVVTRSSVTIRNCVVVDNSVIGICGREQSDLVIKNCEILHNSDGEIALYRDACATISNNLIEGDGPVSSIAIRVWGNARATAERNLIRRHLGGMEITRNPSLIVRGNLIEEVGFGIRVSNESAYLPNIVIERNVAYDCQWCGIAIRIYGAPEDTKSLGRVVGNLIVHARVDTVTSESGICPQKIPKALSIRGNVYYDTPDVEGDPFGRSTTKEMFWRNRVGWVRTFRNTGVGVDGRVKFHESAFLTEYPRWWN